MVKVTYILNSLLLVINGVMWYFYAHVTFMAIGCFLAAVLCTVYARRLDAWSF